MLEVGVLRGGVAFDWSGQVSFLAPGAFRYRLVPRA